jgi:hypothetical protein
MKEMTVAEIAALCEVDYSTVCRWAKEASGKMPEISCKMQKARETSKPATFAVEETLAIVRAGGKATLAALLEENAAKNLPAPKPRILNGKQLEYLYRMTEKKMISPYQVQLLLGVAIPRQNALPEVPASLEQGEAAFQEIMSRFSNPKLPFRKHEMAKKAIEGRAIAESQQGALPLEGGHS